MGSGALYVTVKDIYVGSSLNIGDLGRMKVSKEEAERFGLRAGDLVLGKSSVKREGIGYPNLFLGAPELVVNSGFTYRVRPFNGAISSSFLLQYLRSYPARRWIIDNSQASALTNINGTIVDKYPIVLPPLKEQEAIAEALTDADAAIESLDALIAKKRDVKQAAMQQLLTGRTRLPGFNDEWKEARLGDHGSFSKGRGIKRDEVIASGLPCLRYGQIYTDHNDWIRNFTAFIAPATAQGSRRLVRGELMFTGSGETAAEIGKCVAFLGYEEAYAGGDIVILTPHGVDSKFMGYALNAPAVVQQKVRFAQGDAVVHISASSLASLWVAVPPLKEQEAIAGMLSDMDYELEALTGQVTKLRMVKEGMMQDLLTGKVRLV